MGDVASEGRTVLFVSHNMGAINNLCTKCIWIDKGRLEKSGDTASVIHEYLHSDDQGGNVAEIDLSDFSERYGDGQAKLLAARMLSAEGQPCTEFHRGKPFTVEIDLESRTVSELALTLIVMNDLGINVLHLSHFDSSIPLVISEPGKYRTRMVLQELPLFSGAYKLNLEIHTTHMLFPADKINNVLSFSVSEPLDSSRPFATPSNIYMGWTKSEWSFEEIDGK